VLTVKSNVDYRKWHNGISNVKIVTDTGIKVKIASAFNFALSMKAIQHLVHSNAHKVIAGFFLSPDPEVT
jgi:hypothetical protein